MDWATAHGYIVLTHDLDFGAMLVATQAQGPSVIQVRTSDVLPAHLESLLVGVLKEYAAALEGGALIVVDESRARVRVLPLRP
jgi:predicted nuclease of predicted toxin-antitoxin system